MNGGPHYDNGFRNMTIFPVHPATLVVYSSEWEISPYSWVKQKFPRVDFAITGPPHTHAGHKSNGFRNMTIILVHQAPFVVYNVIVWEISP